MLERALIPFSDSFSFFLFLFSSSKAFHQKEKSILVYLDPTPSLLVLLLYLLTPCTERSILRFSLCVGLHVHVGSQGCDLSLLARAIKTVAQFALELSRLLPPHRLRFIDIGGGLPIDYLSKFTLEDSSIVNDLSYASYFNALNKEGIFNLLAQIDDDDDDDDGGGDDYDDPNCRIPRPKKHIPTLQIITEFGRSLVGQAACVVACIEYTKRTGGRYVATIGTGADLMVREAYLPHIWKHQLYHCNWKTKKVTRLEPYEVHSENHDDNGDDAENDEYDGDGESQNILDIAGPLCFSGDLVGRGICGYCVDVRDANNQLDASSLKQRGVGVSVGDYICIKDCGAYTLSMFSRYNSARAPAVYAIRKHSASPSNERSHAEWKDYSSDLKDAFGNGGEFMIEEKSHGKLICTVGTGESIHLIKPKETIEDVLKFWGQFA